MSAFQGTPGPWSLDDGDGGPFDVFDQDGRLIALLSEKGRHLPEPQFSGNEHLTWHEHRANALLIAAAPELLDFVMSAAKFDPVFAKGAEKERIALARQLVAKAMGAGA